MVPCHPYCSELVLHLGEAWESSQFHWFLQKVNPGNVHVYNLSAFTFLPNLKKKKKNRSGCLITCQSLLAWLIFQQTAFKHFAYSHSGKKNNNNPNCACPFSHIFLWLTPLPICHLPPKVLFSPFFKYIKYLPDDI